MEKRNTAIDLTDLAIGILILGLTVTIGANILLGMRDSRLTSADTFQVANESTFLNTTADPLSTTWFQGVDTCYCNVSGLGVGSACAGNETVLGAANYTVSVNALDGTTSILSATIENYTSVQCTYNVYNTSTQDFALANSAAVGLAEFGNWFDIIVIVGIAGLILALIFMAFGNRGSGSGTEISY